MDAPIGESIAMETGVFWRIFRLTACVFIFSSAGVAASDQPGYEVQSQYCNSGSCDGTQYSIQQGKIQFTLHAYCGTQSTHTKPSALQCIETDGVGVSCNVMSQQRRISCVCNQNQKDVTYNVTSMISC